MLMLIKAQKVSINSQDLSEATFGFNHGQIDARWMSWIDQVSIMIYTQAQQLGLDAQYLKNQNLVELDIQRAHFIVKFFDIMPENKLKVLRIANFDQFSSRLIDSILFMKKLKVLCLSDYSKASHKRLVLAFKDYTPSRLNNFTKDFIDKDKLGLLEIFNTPEGKLSPYKSIRHLRELEINYHYLGGKAQCEIILYYLSTCTSLKSFKMKYLKADKIPTTEFKAQTSIFNPEEKNQKYEEKLKQLFDALSSCLNIEVLEIDMKECYYNRDFFIFSEILRALQQNQHSRIQTLEFNIIPIKRTQVLDQLVQSNFSLYMESPLDQARYDIERLYETLPNLMKLKRFTTNLQLNIDKIFEFLSNRNKKLILHLNGNKITNETLLEYNSMFPQHEIYSNYKSLTT
ncbi:UNKNOWN [Stylonychia lemnae]|uniref:Uncharacterized protein n=1 Tax=Stylonychia lemnae TaxID=5949 RepID=A0A078AJY1_STYLE|nr:UNKNOWN [Stylonychia lemnae]|eukprot:CDW81113.1 UNKNOWN [Stylonychia lemnae]